MTGIPLGLHFTPFSSKYDQNIKKFSFGNGNDPICICKCGAFINPYVMVSNGGWKCNICNNINMYEPSLESSINNIISNNEEVYEIYANSE